MAKVVVAGYGPPDLLERLKRSQWVSCGDGAKNFEGISVAQWVPTDQKDRGYSVRYRFILRAEQGRALEVEGYSIPTLLDEMKVSSCGAVRTMNRPLKNYTDNNKDAFYVFIVRNN
jgi:hypothetical protein